MILSLRIPDEIYEAYLEHNKQNPQAAMEATLKRFAKVLPTDREVVFSRVQRQRLEKLLQLPLEDVDKFIDLVEKLYSLNVDGVSVTLSDGQIRRLKTEAQFYKKDYSKYVGERVMDCLRREIG